MTTVLSARELQRRIPHRFPFLLVDRVTRLEPRVGGTGLKQVTLGDPIFQGHFPDNPVFPGVLILEALGQLAAVVFSEGEADAPSSSGRYFARIDRARFLKPVTPGDTLELEVKVLKEFGGFVKVDGEARVDGALVASAELTFTTG
jgi:beta-hydroxyacyl-ACP dehydratase FabZ